MSILVILGITLLLLFFVVLISFVLSKHTQKNEEDDIIEDILDEPIDGVITAETTYIHTTEK